MIVETYGLPDFRLVDHRAGSRETTARGCERIIQNGADDRILIWEAEPYGLTFEVHECAEEIVYEDRTAKGERIVFDADENGHDVSESPTKHSLIWRGWIKWDGCSHYYPTEYLHHDHISTVPDFRSDCERAWKLAAKYVSHWQGDW